MEKPDVSQASGFYSEIKAASPGEIQKGETVAFIPEIIYNDRNMGR